MANAEDITQVKQQITQKINSLSGNIKTINKQISNLNIVNKRIKALCTVSITLNIGLISYFYNNS